MSRAIRCSSADVRLILEGWVANESAAGARVVVLEGAMSSGKSRLTKEPIILGDRQSAPIHVDDFIHNASNDEGYLNGVKHVPLAAAIQAGLATSPRPSSSWKGRWSGRSCKASSRKSVRVASGASTSSG